MEINNISDSDLAKQWGTDPMGDGTWKLAPSGVIVDRAGFDKFGLLKKKRSAPQNDCLGMSWAQIEYKQGGRLKL